MNRARAERKADLLAFLGAIQRGGPPVGELAEEERIIAAGLIDSLSILQIVSYLEATHGIDFAPGGIDAEQLGSIAGILDLIEAADARR